MQLVLIILLCLVCAGLMWHFHTAHRTRTRAERGAMFDQALTLLDEPALQQDDVDFPLLKGRYSGYQVRLEPMEDHVGYRKLPSLWLLVTVFGELPFRGAFDFLARPENLEFYSPSSRLQHAVPIPEGWPQHGWLRTDKPEAMPPLERLTPHMVFFDDPKAKELLVTARGVRLVYQVNQAERSVYLVLRGVTFGNLSVAREQVRMLLDRAVALCGDLAEP